MCETGGCGVVWWLGVELNSCSKNEGAVWWADIFRSTSSLVMNGQELCSITGEPCLSPRFPPTFLLVVVYVCVWGGGGGGGN